MYTSNYVLHDKVFVIIILEIICFIHAFMNIYSW